MLQCEPQGGRKWAACIFSGISLSAGVALEGRRVGRVVLIG